MQVVERNNVKIKRTRSVVRVEPTAILPNLPLHVEIRQSDKPLGSYDVTPGMGFEESFGDRVDLTRCAIRVTMGGTALAEMPARGEEEFLPFMRVQGEQRHITESYVSVPPSLTITDEIGAVFTLGFATAPKEKSPDGEFAFEVLRDGIGTKTIASRIERRGGRVRAFTRRGWKWWNGTAFG